MTLEELYEYYECNWVLVCKEINFGRTTIQVWRKMGFIPLRAQKVIENRTDGLFKAEI